MNYFDVLINTTIGTANWVWNLITFNVSWDENYFYGLILVSLLVWGLELLFPWRKNQTIFRKDFWLDGFYMFFNFFIFSIIISGIYAVIGQFFWEVGVSMNTFSLISKESMPNWLFILIFFVLNDFVQWVTHFLLHKYDFLWNFHKVHHSVTEMGFAAHLRYHWMENLFYKPLKTLVVMVLVGAEPEHAFFVHFFAITIGHLNHANVRITWGPFKYLINNSVMHLYHHAKTLPKERVRGVNFGISLSLWDYVFKTNYIPQSEDGSYQLGFEGVEYYPKSFFKQFVSGFRKS